MEAILFRRGRYKIKSSVFITYKFQILIWRRRRGLRRNNHEKGKLQLCVTVESKRNVSGRRQGSSISNADRSRKGKKEEI